MASLWDLYEINRLPDVVVADFDLPALNAIQLTHEIRRHAEIRRVFVAILSTTPAEMDRVAGETAGADYFENYRAAGSDLHEKFQEIGRMICRANPVSR
jgi:CheY-like chemotaxis protein